MIPEPLEIGRAYRLSFTHPLYNPGERRYLPDSFRFTEPDVVDAVYGGRCKERYKCAVCGRWGGEFRQFLNISDGSELFLSNHCFAHDSTRVWPSGTEEGTIEKWYREESLRRDAENGDGLANLVLALRDLEDREEEYRWVGRGPRLSTA